MDVRYHYRNVLVVVCSIVVVVVWLVVSRSLSLVDMSFAVEPVM